MQELAKWIVNPMGQDAAVIQIAAMVVVIGHLMEQLTTPVPAEPRLALNSESNSIKIVASRYEKMHVSYSCVNMIISIRVKVDTEEELPQIMILLAYH